MKKNKISSSTSELRMAVKEIYDKLQEKKNKRVLFPFHSSEIGGAEISACLLINEITKRGIEVICAVQQGTNVERYVNDNIGKENCIQFRVIHEKNHCYSYFIDMVKIAINNNIGLVHTNDNAGHLCWSTIERIFNLKHIVHHRNNNVIQANVGSFSFNSYKKSNVIYISKFVSEFSSIKPKLAQIIYNPIEFYQKYVYEFNSSEPIRLVYAGRGVGYKKVEMLVKIISYMIKNGFNRNMIEGHYYGVDDKSWEWIKKHVNELKLKDKIFRFTWSKNIFNTVPRNTIFICSAVEEPFGRLAAECCMYGFPLVASNSGGHRETVPHDGIHLLANASDVEDFSIQVLKIYSLFKSKENKSNSLRDHQINLDYKNLIRERHSIESHGVSVLDFYNRICEDL